MKMFSEAEIRVAINEIAKKHPTLDIDLHPETTSTEGYALWCLLVELGLEDNPFEDE